MGGKGVVGKEGLRKGGDDNADEEERWREKMSDKERIEEGEERGRE